MIREIRGNLLDVQQGIIAHQVNCKGVMGAGVAREIRKRVLSGEQYGHYQDMCKKHGGTLLGKCFVYPVENKAGLFVANLFGENIPTGKGLDTDYGALEECLKRLKQKAWALKVPVSIPGYLGCGLAGGDWDYVYNRILAPVFKDSSVELTIVYLPDSVRKLWDEFGNVPMDPETERMEAAWHGFPAGAHREEIWGWFEETFDLSVAADLMGQEEEPSRKGNGGPEGQRMNFQQKYVSGLCGFGAIDDEIAAWHESEEALDLGEYLGFSAREYAEFLQKDAQEFEQYLNRLRNAAPAPGGWDLEPLIRRDLVTPGSRVHCLWDERGQWVSLDYTFSEETGSAKDYSLVFAELYEDGEPDEMTWREARDCAWTLSEKIGLPLAVERYDATAMQNMLRKVLPRYAGKPEGVKELIRMGFSPEHLRHFGVKVPGPLNTEIQYLYRDACNYKLRTLCVLAGTLTEAEKGEILECLIDGEYFVPGQVGLPDDNRFSGTEDDTDWFELESIEDTDHSPTLSMTAQELLENFRKAKGNWTNPAEQR